jgi:hypothetical protein
VLLEDFLTALRRLPDRPLLAIGQRWDCDITTPLDFDQPGGALAAWARANGTLDKGSGSDYFLFPRSTDFGLPAFAVGRPGWDNWMMGRTLELKLPLIDITAVTTVVHQNHDYGHVASRKGSQWEGPEADRNRQFSAWIERYVHSPANATLMLTADGLRKPRTARHLRAKLEEFVALRPVAAPARRLLRALPGRRTQPGADGA